MCGIVGMIGNRPAAPVLVDGLKRLEYRGYDSAGIATLEDGVLSRIRAQGKLANLEARVDADMPAGEIGIGHTRWATHGAPNERNAHPHATTRVSVVHNGIIENFRMLRDELQADGYVFETETDTETIAQLLTKYLDAGDAPQVATQKCLKRLEGAFALAILFNGETDLMAAARRGSPLAIGHGSGEVFLGSDAIALAPFTDSITYLEEGDWAVLTRNSVTIFDEAGEEVIRAMTRSSASSLMVDKGNHRHFMIKEIYEQPEVVSHTLAAYVDLTTDQSTRFSKELDFSSIDRITIAACGTAYYAGLVAKYWFERFARLPVEIDFASEFRYRELPLPDNGVSIVISQSGETADTLASLRYCKENGQKIVAVVNVPESTIAREADIICPTLAGPEIGVASTKAFTCQLTALASLAVQAGRQRGTLSAEDEQKLVGGFKELPRLMLQAMKLEPEIEALARKLSKANDLLYLGRGTSYPVAMEGALKLKEISYIHAEAYAAGELKHGPIALIDEKMPVVVIAPYDQIFEKTVSNMQEVAARGGRIILFTDEKGAAEVTIDEVETIIMPDVAASIAPIVYAIPMQLLAYHVAIFIGTDVDQPRNLAKSVTVE